MKVILAIDGGGSRTRCLAIDQAGQVIGQAETGPSNHLLVAIDVARRSLAEAIDQTLKSSRLNRNEVTCLSAGLAGVDFDGSGAPAMEGWLRELGAGSVVVSGDMVIAHAGALTLRQGVIALAGTGSAILGIGANGRRVKVGGWGPVYGDEGSAYRIGQMSLRAAARYYDGCGPATALKEALLDALNLREFRETVERVYVEAMEPREIAALSSVAYDAAVAGDEVARAIFLQAGDEIAEGVVAAMRKLGQIEREVLVSYQGAILESCHLVRDRFAQTLKDRLPGVSIVPPRFPPVIGAYLLGCQAMDWPVDDESLARLEAGTVSR